MNQSPKPEALQRYKPQDIQHSDAWKLSDDSQCYILMGEGVKRVEVEVNSRTRTVSIWHGDGFRKVERINVDDLLATVGRPDLHTYDH